MRQGGIRSVSHWLRPAGVLILVGISAWALTGPLARALPAPRLFSVSSPAGWRAWLKDADPVIAAATLLRLLAVGLSGWLALGLVATAVIVVAEQANATTRRWCRALHGAGWMLRAAVPRPLLTVTVALLGAASAGCTRYGSGALGAQPRGSGGTGAPATVTMTQTPPPIEPAAPAPPTAPLAPEASIRVVRPGDSLWSMAETVVRAHGGTQAQVGPYWLAVVRANHRARPDLIHPGEVVELPAYPG